MSFFLLKKKKKNHVGNCFNIHCVYKDIFVYFMDLGRVLWGWEGFYDFLLGFGFLRFNTVAVHCFEKLRK